MADTNPAREIGLVQGVPAKAGVSYRASVQVKAVKGVTPAGSFIQMRFRPSNKLVQKEFKVEDDGEFHTVSVSGTSPEGTQRIVIYLYTHRKETPQVLLAAPELVEVVQPTKAGDG